MGPHTTVIPDLIRDLIDGALELSRRLSAVRSRGDDRSDRLPSARSDERDDPLRSHRVTGRIEPRASVALALGLRAGLRIDRAWVDDERRFAVILFVEA